MKKFFDDVKILVRLLVHLKSLTFVMMLTILFGVLGYLAASGILVFSVLGAMRFLGLAISIPIKRVVLVVIVLAVGRGFFKYFEQLSGHFVAFRILADLRSEVFEKLKTLAPAKLDLKDQGDLVTILTADVEALEVFYAHTIAPIMISLLTGLVFLGGLFWIDPAYALLALGAYVLLGVVLPFVFRYLSDADMAKYREGFWQSNSYFLDALQGLSVTLFFGYQEKSKAAIEKRSEVLSDQIEKVKKMEAINFAMFDGLVLLFMMLNLLMGAWLWSAGRVDFSGVLVSFVAFSSSFGAVSAISALSTVFSGTIASARRLFDVLDESPLVEEVAGEDVLRTADFDFEKVGFYYPNRERWVLKDLTFSMREKGILAIVGESGVGKSTILKLMMRFYDPILGRVSLDEVSLDEMATKTLRGTQALIAQKTFLFNATIEENIRMRNFEKPFEDVVRAAEKAAIHDFVISLPEGYATPVGELGERLSEGQKQRIGLARAFFKDSEILLLDEPTSNLDVLNEAVILKSLKEGAGDRQVVLVSHRRSTTAIADEIFDITER